MKKFVFAAVCTVTLVGFVMADEFGAVITKVDGKTVTYFKTMPGGGGKGGKGGKGGGFGGGKKTGDALTATVSAKVVVAKGVVEKGDAGITFTKGDAIEGGLTSDAFKTIDAEKGVNVRITIADDGADKGKITQILQVGGKKKGG